MKKLLQLLAVTAVTAILTTRPASAHVGYGGRDFGTDPVSVTISNQTVSSAFGWADATDDDWGDSHRGRFFRFTLTTPASVMITVERNSLGTGETGTFLPAFSLYYGLAQLSPEQGGHDAVALSLASRPEETEGSLRALTDWSIGNDPTYVVSGDPGSGILYAARLAYLTYVGHAADGTTNNYGNAAGINGDGNADGYVTFLFENLAAGDYSLFVGGANYAAQGTETGPTYPTYGITTTVSVVPEPSTWALVLTGVAATALLRRRTKK